MTKTTTITKIDITPHKKTALREICEESSDINIKALEDAASNKNKPFCGYSVSELDTNGFDELDANSQHLVYHLSMAGIVARDIIYHQTSIHSLAVKEVLEDIYANVKIDGDIKANLLDDLQLVWISNGIYQAGTGDRITPKTAAFIFQDLLNNPEIKSSKELQEIAYYGLYDPNVPANINSGSDSELSGFNASSPEISHKARKKYLSLLNQVSTLFFKKRTPPTGLNLYLENNDKGEIVANYYSANGKLGHLLSKVVEQLKLALPYAEKQNGLTTSLLTLIDFLEDGNPLLFDKHSIEWVTDTNTKIFFVLGFMETYSDPLKEMGSFQSIVGIDDPIGSKMVELILEKAQYLEDNLPIESRFKRKVAKGNSGRATNILGFSGDAGPALALGNLLPNNWIREQVGSRATIFSNVLSDRAAPSQEVINRFLPKQYHGKAKDFLRIAINLWVQLHESAGHASGTLLPGVTENTLGSTGSIIEECRADLVAMYYIGDQALIKEILSVIAPEIEDIELFIKIAYSQYLTDGCLYQLTRVPKDAVTLKQTHFRNRQINSTYVIDEAIKNGCAHWEDNGFGQSLVINDIETIRDTFGELLNKIQTIRSTGDKEGARNLVLERGTAINMQFKQSAEERKIGLFIPIQSAFLTPFFIPTGNKDKPYRLVQAKSFVDDQMALSELSKSGELPNRVKNW